MGLTTVVAGTDVSALVDVRSLEIDQVLTRRGDTAKLDLLDDTLALTVAPFASISITDELGNSKFAGVVTKPRQIVSDGPAINRWHLECQDYTYYLQKTLCNKKYQQQGVDAIVKDLLANFPPGVAITTNNVQEQLPVLQYFNAPHLTLADAFDKLVRMSTSTAFLMWDVDTNKDLHFFDENHVPAGDVTLTDVLPTVNPSKGSTPDQFAGGLPTGYANYLRETFWYERDVTQFANQVTFRGGTTLSNTYSQTWVGNGSQTSYVLDYPPDTSTQAGGYVPTVTVAGVSQTVALDTSAGFGSNQCLVSLDQQAQTATLRFASAPASGAAIVATYVYDIPILVRIKDNQSVINYGTWEQYVVDTNVKSVQAAVNRASSILSQFRSPLATANVDVDRSYVGKLGAGQLITLVNTQQGINQSMIVTDCRITGQPGAGYAYNLRLAAFA